MIDHDWHRFPWKRHLQSFGASFTAKANHLLNSGALEEYGMTDMGDWLAIVGGDGMSLVAVTRGDVEMGGNCSCELGRSCPHMLAALITLRAELKKRGDMRLVDTEWMRERRLELADARRAETVAGVSVVDVGGWLAEQSEEDLRGMLSELAEQIPMVGEQLEVWATAVKASLRERVRHTEVLLEELCSQPGFSHGDHPSTAPDYARLKQQFEGLVEMGASEDLVALAFKLLDGSVRQLNDSGERVVSDGIANCLAVLVRGMMASDMAPVRQILVAHDIQGRDDFGVAHCFGRILRFPWPSQVWSMAADALCARVDAGAEDDVPHAIGALQRAGRFPESMVLRAKW